MDKTNEKTDNPKTVKKNVRNTESLMGRGDKGKILIVTRGAVTLAAKNDFEGTKLKGKGKSGGTGRAFLHRIGGETTGKPKGTLWTAEDEVIKKIKVKAAAANKDVHEGKYTQSVKDFINKTYDELKREGGRGERVTPMVF